MKPDIVIKEGWVLNPNKKRVESIRTLIEKNNGECICHNESTDKKCPCTDYRDNNTCHCHLYLKKIKLPNRDGDNNYLIPVGNYDYLLSTESCYMRVIYDDDKTTIKAVDPSGGPFMSIGDKIEGKTITSIVFNKGFILTLKD